jgi:hypothetical protein
MMTGRFTADLNISLRKDCELNVNRLGRNYEAAQALPLWYTIGGIESGETDWLPARMPGGSMKEITRELILDQLNEGWGDYVESFMRLPPDGQKQFLQKQGYATLYGLLGHVIAWWELGKYTIEQILIEPDFNSTQVDVDQFNAEAVERFSDYDEDEIIEEFEKMRRLMLVFVEGLPDSAFINKRINERLYVEVIDHFEEHN